MDPRTETAIALLAEAKDKVARATWRPTETAGALPSGASVLKTLLTTTELEELSNRQRAYSRRASEEKVGYSDRSVRATVIAAFGAVFGGVALYVEGLDGAWTAETNVAFALLQIAAFLVAGYYVLGLLREQPYASWQKLRAEAETLRFKIFADLSRAAPPPQTPLEQQELFRPLVVEYLRTYLLQHQLAYFRDRVSKAWWAALLQRVLKFVALLAILITALLGVAALAAKLPVEALQLAIAAEPLVLVRNNGALFQLIALIGLTMLGLTRSVDTILLTARNTRKYQEAALRLEIVEAKWLDKARAAALVPAAQATLSAGGEDPVIGFAKATVEVLTKELDGWTAVVDVLPNLVFEDFVWRG